MSYQSLSVQVVDQALRDRVNACINQEARENASVSDSSTAEAIRRGGIGVLEQFVWPVALNSESEYAYALNAGNPNPGGDEAVVSDTMILSAVQAVWPEEEP